MVVRLRVEPHPSLAVAAFEATLPRPLGELTSSKALLGWLDRSSPAPVQPDEERRERVRQMLRHGGYKPSGRGKPASEYLARSAAEAPLGTINPAVDACNAVSLHAGFPISVVDLDRVGGELGIRLGRAGEQYVFNASGQTIDLHGLVVLCDDEGPAANAVKDSQRTKTHGGTCRTLSILWGTAADRDALEAALVWYRELVEEHLGATTEVVATLPAMAVAS